jgi:phage gpG-like protein
MVKQRGGAFPDFQKIIKDLEDVKKQLKKLPTYAGTEALNFFKQSFKRQGFIDEAYEPWKPRKERTAGRKMRREGRRAVLVKSGRLRRSLRKKVTGTVIEILTDVPYAEIHNEGGTIQTTANVRNHDRRTKRGKTQVSAHTRRVNMKIPKRQFMGESAFLNKRFIFQFERLLRAIPIFK